VATLELGKKNKYIKWNPSAQSIIAVGCNADFVSVWNVESSQEVCNISVEEKPTCLVWNYDGSLLGTHT